MNSWQSAHETFSTGRSSLVKKENFLKDDGLFPITLFHCSCVTGYLPSQKPLVSVTRCLVSLSFRPSSPSGLPIMKLPGGHQIISIFAPPGRASMRTSPAGRDMRVPAASVPPGRAVAPRPPSAAMPSRIHVRIGRSPFSVKSASGTTLPPSSSRVLSTAFTANTSSHR